MQASPQKSRRLRDYTSIPFEIFIIVTAPNNSIQMNSELFAQFNAWIDRLMIEFGSTPVVAYNFNLYEHEEEFAIQLVGTGSFDLSDEDWACDEIFSSGEDLFYLPHSVFGDQWQTGLEVANSLVKNYLQHGKHAASMKSTHGVGVGFVSGDIELVYVRADS